MYGQADSEFGVSVGSTGDVNGDGYADVIVGARWHDSDHTDEGAAFLYYGSSTGLITDTLGWMAESDQSQAEFGRSVGTAGDVNGDSYADIIIGAPHYGHDQVEEGAVFVWYGSANGLGSSGTPSNADWSAETNQSQTEFGRSSGTAGDVNGDSYDDVIVGAWRYSKGQEREGVAFV